MDYHKEEIVKIAFLKIAFFVLFMGFAYVLFNAVLHTQREPEVAERKLSSNVSVLVIDSCEYIRAYGERLIHKTNCRFCAKRNLHKSQNKSDTSKYNEE